MSNFQAILSTKKVKRKSMEKKKTERRSYNIDTRVAFSLRCASDLILAHATAIINALSTVSKYIVGVFVSRPPCPVIVTKQPSNACINYSLVNRARVYAPVSRFSRLEQSCSGSRGKFCRVSSPVD